MKYFTSKEIETVRALSAKAEESKRIPKEWLKIIYDKKLFKLFVPKKSSGLMMPLPDALRVFEEAACIDGNFGWAITIGSGGGYFYAFMKPDIASKVFDKPTAVIAGSGVQGIGKAVKGGYKVSGYWNFCSGSSYATSFTANVLVDKDTFACILKPEQVNIHNDWNAFGMKATESNSINAKDALVTADMTFDLTSKLYFEHPFYHYPFLQFAETSFAAVSLGLCRHFFEEANEMIEGSKKYWSAVSSRYNFVKNIVLENETYFEKASAQFYKVADASWQELLKKGELSDTTQNNVSEISRKTSRIVLASIDAVIQYLGMNAIMEDTAINRIWRDTHTVCQHILLVPFNKVL